jgi:hypothetical protein
MQHPTMALRVAKVLRAVEAVSFPTVTTKEQAQIEPTEHCWKHNGWLTGRAAGAAVMVCALM